MRNVSVRQSTQHPRGITRANNSSRNIFRYNGTSTYYRPDSNGYPLQNDSSCTYEHIVTNLDRRSKRLGFTPVTPALRHQRVKICVTDHHVCPNEASFSDSHGC